MDREKLVQTVLDCGAEKAAVVSQSQIVTSAHFRAICASNQCGGYGGSWMCPPYIGEIEPLMAKVRSYPYGILYQSIHQIEDSFDIEGMSAASVTHAQLSQKIQAAVKPLIGNRDFLHLTCGGCHLCDVCAIKTNEPCRMPDKALSSLEGYGIDVYKTVKGTDLKYMNGVNTVTFFGIILISE